MGTVRASGLVDPAVGQVIMGAGGSEALHQAGRMTGYMENRGWSA